MWRQSVCLFQSGIGHFADILNFRREDTETKKGARIPEDTLINSVYRQIRSSTPAKQDRPVSPLVSTASIDPSPLRVNVQGVPDSPQHVKVSRC